MTLKAQLESYLARMKAFNEWEAGQPPEERPPEAILADLGFLLTFVSVEDRARDSDPQKAEDLILMKLISERPKDLDDVYQAEGQTSRD